MLMISNANAKQCKFQIMLSNSNVKQCKCQTMLSNAKYMLDKYTDHAEHILCTYLQNADYGQCICKATLPIRVNDGGKEKKRRKEKKRKGKRREEMAVPRAAAAYGQQLKKGTFSNSTK